MTTATLPAIPITTTHAGTPFSLPMMAIISVAIHPTRTVAHALDFDLVAVAETEKEALRKVRLAVKHHVEFGLRNSFNLDILYKAPQAAWDAMTPDTALSIGEPIEIDHCCSLKTATVTDESTEGSRAA
jgi:hypothetical protein